MTLNRSTWIVLGMAGLALSLSLAFWGKLPEQMPTHFGLDGVPDAYGSRLEGAMLLPGIMAGLAVFWRLLPVLSPRGYGVLKFESVVSTMALVTGLFLLLLHITLLRAAVTGQPPSTSMIFAGTAVLVALLGNWMGKLRRNFYVGIRTPWTLADDEVWLQTHRLGGKLMVGGGIVAFFLSFVPGAFPFWLAAILVPALLPAGYSFVVYRRLHPQSAPSHRPRT
jgi:uncharacterized membrane protein